MKKMGLVVVLLSFIVGFIVGIFLTKNIIFSLVIGVIAVLVVSGFITIGVDWGKFLPKLW